MGAAPPTPRLATRQKLDDLLSAQTAKGNLPAIFFAATNAEETLYLNQAGQRVHGEPDKGTVTEDTPVELYSQTKILTSTAALQLVEAGKLELDSAAGIEKWLPELGTVKLLTGYDDAGNGILVNPKAKITLRMLLTHTSGLVYAFLESPATKYFAANGPASQFNCGLEGITTPLVFEPGAAFAYSHATDWVGILIERVSGTSLEEYFKKAFFEPLGMTTVTFYPTEKIHDTKMSVCTRVPPSTGSIYKIPGDFGMGRATKPEDLKIMHGGAGLYGSQKDYLKFLRAVLASDPRRVNPKALLSPFVYKSLFTSALPEPTAGPHRQLLSEFITAWMPDEPPYALNAGNLTHSLGCGLNLTDAPGRRKAGSVFWGGVAKTAYWIDPESGIAGVVGTNMLVAGRDPDPWQPFLYAFERTVYASLAQPPKANL